MGFKGLNSALAFPYKLFCCYFSKLSAWVLARVVVAFLYDRGSVMGWAWVVSWLGGSLWAFFSAIVLSCGSGCVVAWLVSSHYSYYVLGSWLGLWLVVAICGLSCVVVVAIKLS